MNNDKLVYKANQFIKQIAEYNKAIFLKVTEGQTTT